MAANLTQSMKPVCHGKVKDSSAGHLSAAFRPTVRMPRQVYKQAKDAMTENERQQVFDHRLWRDQGSVSQRRFWFDHI